MNNRIVHLDDDGRLCITAAVPEMFDPESGQRKQLEAQGIHLSNDSEVMHFIISRIVPPGRNYRVVHEDELPRFRDFRDAWIHDGKTITHDMAKANNIKRDMFRALRKPLLEALDVAYLEADEKNDHEEKKSVAARKQALRDITKFQDLNDINELREYMPDILKPQN